MNAAWDAGAPSAHRFTSPAIVGATIHPGSHRSRALRHPLLPGSAPHSHPEPPRPARPRRVPQPREVLGTHRLRSWLRCAPHETESRRREQQAGGGCWEPAAAAGKSRGFAVPQRRRPRGMGGGGTPAPAGPVPRASWRSASFADGAQRRPQGTRGALALYVDARLRHRDKGWRARGARVDSGSPRLPGD